ncbi:MAG TPA: AAA family ATPase, partial [Acidimicrobiales bacterium]|nr:AAA family ATPase [Acidimicrobiales bacterium]
MDATHGLRQQDRALAPRARLRPPTMRALPRERLLALLTAAPHPLMLMTGPAGCGKTTLLSQLVAADPHRQAVWYQLDAGDARVPVLLDHLAQALGDAVPGLGDPWTTPEQAAEALEDARPESDDVLLALDDLHVIGGTAGEEALGRLLDLAPPWLHVAVASRQPPGWRNLSRLRVSGTLLELGPDDLRFRPWEVERLFADLYREPLPPGDLAQLTRGLEGWAAGLQLFHLATRGKPLGERRRAIASLPARSKLIREYLTGNVLDELPDELRAFLLETSMFGRLSPALCDELRGRDDSQRLLDDLVARQGFVEPVDEDDSSRTYRYHEVFRTYLEGRLVERDGQDRARDWARRGAQLLEADGHMLGALRAYCRAEDWDSVGRVLQTAGAELVDDAASWLDWLPPGLIEDDPWAMLATARRAAVTGRFTRALDLYARAELLPDATVVAEMCRRERAELAGWVDPGAPLPRGWGGRMLGAMRARPREAMILRTGTETAGLYAGRALSAGIGSLLTGDLHAATRILVGVIDDPEGEPAAVAAGHMVLAVVRALGGGAVEADVDAVAELLDATEAPWLGWMVRAIRSLDGSAEGWQHAQEAANAFERLGDSWGSAAARWFAVIGAVMAGGSPAVEIDDLSTQLQDLDASVPACWCRAWLATALARRGSADARAVAADAERRADRAGVPGAQVWAISVQAQLAAAAGDDEAARHHAGRAETLRQETGVDVVAPPLHPGAGGEPAAPAPAPPAPLPAAQPLRVRCLGGLVLEIDGRPVELAEARPRARAALRLLAAHAGRPVHVETLTEALWPGGDPVAGKRSLQVALSSLRGLLDAHAPGAGALIERRDNGYLLELPDGAESDVSAFATAGDACRTAARPNDDGDVDVDAVIAAGEEALAAYGGDLLPEEGPAEWVVPLRRSLAHDAAEVAQL